MEQKSINLQESELAPRTCWVLQESYCGDPFFYIGIYLDEDMANKEKLRRQKEDKHSIFIVNEEDLISPNAKDDPISRRSL